MITVENVNKSFGTQQVLKNINFSIVQGEIVGFLGMNGAGKTTMMRILTSYLPPTSGKVSVAGFDVDRQHMQVRQNLGYLSENPPLYYSMSVRDYLLFAAKLKDVPRKSLKYQVDYALDRCLLRDVAKKPIRILSKGFKQRVGLAQAILNDPKVLILDEPTSGLDPIQINQVRTLLNDLKQDHTVIISTHILSEIETLAQRVLVLKDGSIALDRFMSEILTKYQSLEHMFLDVHSANQGQKPYWQKNVE